MKTNWLGIEWNFKIYLLLSTREFHDSLSMWNIRALFLGARVAQWWEHSPLTNVARVQIPASTPYVGWVWCWFSPLLWEVFLQVLPLSPLVKNQQFLIPIPSGTHNFNEFLRTPKCSAGKQNYKFRNMDRVLGVSGSARDGNTVTFRK